MTGFDRQTLDFYAAEAGPYLEYRPETVDSHILDFLNLLPSGAHILELGCGGGNEAACMIGKGFDVDATDGVAEMAAIAEKQLGRRVRIMRFDELEAIDKYDGVVANASLLHVPAASLNDILSRIWQALKPGGWHFATYKTAAQEGRDEHGRYYNYLSRDDAEVRYRSTGDWETLHYTEFAGIGYFSKPAQWLKVVAQKN